MTATIGRYEIHEELGRGGMATVFRGFDPRFKREVAIKLLPREFLHDPNFRARFEREATTIAALEHSAIVPVYDFGEEDGLPYLVMRFMPGGSLAERLDDQQLSLEVTAQILNRIAGALDFAHSKGVVHRDLKPANILFDQHGDAYLGDFGIVKLTEEAATLTGTGGIVGTPAYMSPEQARGKGEIDRRSDLYSLGVILFQMLTGNQPYEADTPIGLAFMHITEPTPDVLESRPDLPQGMGTFIQKAMAKEKDDRFGTASELAGAFERSSSDEAPVQAQDVEYEPTVVELDPTLVEPEPEPEEPAAAPPVSVPERPSPAGREPRPARRSLLPLLGVGGVIVVAGGIAIFALSGGAELFAPAPSPTSTASPSPTSIPTSTRTSTPDPTATITLTPTPGFDPRAMVEIARPLDGPYDVHAVAWSPDGSMLAALDRGEYSLNTGEAKNGNLHVWETAGFRALVSEESVNNTYPEIAAWSLDGTLLATSGRSSAVQLWNTETWDLSLQIDLTEETGRLVGVISALAWSPAQNEQLAIGSNDGFISVWDVSTAEQLTQFCCSSFGRAHGYLAWSDDASMIASLLGSGFAFDAIVWDAATGDQLLDIPGQYYGVEFSPRQARLVGVGREPLYSAYFLYVWDASSGSELLRLQLEDYAIMARWSPSGEVIAVALRHVIEIRDADSGELLHTLGDYDPAVEVSMIQFIDWSPDGTMLAAASLDGTVRVFGMPAD